MVVFALVPRENAPDSASEGDSGDEAEAEVEKKAEGRETEDANIEDGNLEKKNAISQAFQKDAKTQEKPKGEIGEFEPSPSDLD